MQGRDRATDVIVAPGEGGKGSVCLLKGFCFLLSLVVLVAGDAKGLSVLPAISVLSPLPITIRAQYTLSVAYARKITNMNNQTFFYTSSPLVILFSFRIGLIMGFLGF